MTDLIPSDGSFRRAALPGPGRAVPPLRQALSEDYDTVDLRTLLVVVRRRRGLIALITALTFALAAFLTLTQRPEYRAGAVIRLLDQRQAITGGIEGAAVEQMLGKSNDPLLTQLQVLRSRGVAGAVVERTGLRLHSIDEAFSTGALAEIAEFRVAPEAPADTLTLQFDGESYALRTRDGGEARAVYGEPVRLAGVEIRAHRPAAASAVPLAILAEQSVVDELLVNLRATPRDGTNVVDVEYTSPHPLISQRVVNAVVEEFSETSARQAQEQSRLRRSFIEEQLQQSDAVLEQAQQELSDFREREQVFSSQQKFIAQQTGLMGLDVRREELGADRRMYEALLASIGTEGVETSRGLRTLVSAPGIASNPVIAQLYEQLVRYEASHDSLTTGSWGSARENPDVQRLNGLIASTHVKLISAVRSHVQALDAHIEALDDLNDRYAAELQQLPATEAEEARLVQRLETVRAIADQLRGELQRARIAEAVQVGQVDIIDRAPLPVEPVGSSRGLKLALGLVLGLMLGSGGAFLREHLDPVVRESDDVDRALQVPRLGVIPRISEAGSMRRFPLAMRSRDDGASRPLSLVSVVDERSSGAEAFRAIRTNLLFSELGAQLKSVVVTSAGAREGKTTTASNLAVAFAQQGLRTLLIDCDLRRPSLHQVFEMPLGPGLVHCFTEGAELSALVRRTVVPNLAVLTAGSIPLNPAEMLGSIEMARLLDRLKEAFDLVLLDTPPLMGAVDAAILGAKADGTLLVVRAGQTERPAVQAAGEQLAAVGARILGAIINDPDAKLDPVYGSYYYSYYGSDDGDGGPGVRFRTAAVG